MDLPGPVGVLHISGDIHSGETDLALGKARSAWQAKPIVQMKILSGLIFVGSASVVAAGIMWLASSGFAETSKVDLPRRTVNRQVRSDEIEAPGSDLKASGDGIERSRSSASLANEIVNLLASTDPLDQSKVYRELLPRFVQEDPRAAADFAQSAAAAKWRADLMVVVAQTWADIDVDDAEKWATQLGNPSERNMVLGYVSFEEANTDPARAARILENGALSPDRRELIVANLAQQWANQDLQPLYDELDRLPPSEDRDGLFRYVALAQARTAPAQAAEMIAEKMSAGPTQFDTTMYVLREWARRDMSSAVAWANQFPSGKLHDRAMQVLSGELYGAYLPENTAW